MSNRTFMLLSAIVLIVGGILAILAPIVASLAVVLIVGWSLVIAGVLHIVEAFRETEHRLWNAGFGLLGLLLGLSFVFNPLGGLISLAIVLGALFFALGLMQLYAAWKGWGASGRWYLGISGAISVLLAVVIALNVQAAAATLPGFLLAVELISTGVALLVLRRGLGQTAPPLDEPEASGTTSAVELPRGR